MTQAQTTNLQSKGFLGSLFDFSFKSLIGSKVIRVLYVLWMVWLALLAVGFIITAFEINPALGAIALLVLGPLYFLFNLIFARVVLELVMAIFAIQENTSRIPPITWSAPASAHSEVANGSSNGSAENITLGPQNLAPAN